MSFEDRKAQALALLADFLTSYVPPRGITDEGLERTMYRIADAFARKMPLDGDFNQACEIVFQKVRDTHLSNTWPTQAAFVMAMPVGDTTGRRAAETFRPPDYSEWLEARMQSGVEVPEAALWGPHSSGVSHNLLNQYRQASVQNWRQFFGKDARGAMVARYGDIVAPFFHGGGR